MSHRTALRGLVVSGGLALGACSFSTGSTPARAAETLIESVLGEQADMTFIDAVCEKPTDGEVGTRFECTANSDSAVVTFAAVIDPDDMIFVAPSNLVLADEMALVEEEAADVLGPEVGVVIDPADVDCPEQTTVLDEHELHCEITDPATGDRYELIVVFGEFVPREGYGGRSYAIGDQPL